MKNIYLLVGPSGSGKTTIQNELKRLYGYKTIESYTDRPKRHDNETGHTFLTAEEFNSLPSPLCAYTVFDNCRYGVTLDMIESSDIFVVDVPGAKYMLEEYKGSKGVKVIGIIAPKLTLINRMQERGGSVDEINLRLSNDSIAFSKMCALTEDILLNTDIDVTVAVIKEIIDEAENS